MRERMVYADDSMLRRPTAETVTHLSEYVVRLALRDGWDLADTRANTDRLQRLMFADRELIEMASLSGVKFTEEISADVEVVLSVSDIGYNRRTVLSASLPSALIMSSDFMLPMPVLSGSYTSLLSRTSAIAPIAAKRHAPAANHFGFFSGNKAIY